MISHLVFFCFTQVACVAQLVYKLPEGITVSSSLLPFTAPGTDLDAEEKHFKYNLDWFCRKICTLISLTRMEWHWIEWNCWWTLSVLTWMTVNLPETSQIKRDQKKKEKKKTRNYRFLKNGLIPSHMPSSHKVYNTSNIQIFPIKNACHSEEEKLSNWMYLHFLVSTSPYPSFSKKPQIMTILSKKTGLWVTQRYMVHWG